MVMHTSGVLSLDVGNHLGIVLDPLLVLPNHLDGLLRQRVARFVILGVDSIGLI